MARKEIKKETQSADNKKMRTKDLIFAGAFGAVYLVLMLIIVMASGMVPILYIFAPLTVGVVCATVYELCVLKVHKFGAALILGVLFAVVSCMGNWIGFVGAIAAALLSEFVIFIGKYKSKKMFLLSFVLFNINMACPYTLLALSRDSFMQRAHDFYGEDYANGLAAVTPSWIWFGILGLAILGGAIGALISSGLIKKHFEKAGII